MNTLQSGILEYSSRRSQLMQQHAQKSKFGQRTLRGEIPTSSCLVDLTAGSWRNSRWNCQWWSEDIFSETETLTKTDVSRHETSRDISDLVETRRDWDIVKMFETWETADTQVSRHETSQNNLTLLRHAFTKHTLQSLTDCLTSTYYCHTVIEFSLQCFDTVGRATGRASGL